MKKKTYALRADQIKPLAEGHGACFATDRITVDGKKVGYMYREDPDEDVDSGWRFMAGDEFDDLEAVHAASRRINGQRAVNGHSISERPYSDRQVASPKQTTRS